MRYRTYFESVEEVLKKYPESWSKNYCENNPTVIIEEQPVKIKSKTGTYYHEENKIVLYKVNALPHELFHMAFRDPKKVGSIEESEYSISNGVAFSKEGNFVLKAATEGFAEYLNRKCQESHSKVFEFYFMDLLLSIYGEEILKYPFFYDPFGFLTDERFYDLFSFLRVLDNLEFCTEKILILNFFHKCGELDPKRKKDSKSVLKVLDTIISLYNNSIVEANLAIIEEFSHCARPKISRKEYT